MMLTPEQDKNLIRQVIRGEKSWKELEALEIRVHRQGNQCQVDNPRRIIASVDIRDLAQGLMHYRGIPGVGREWAFLLEAETFLDWDAVQEHPAGETLLNAVWDVSFGEPLSGEALQTAEQLLQEEKSEA